MDKNKLRKHVVNIIKQNGRSKKEELVDVSKKANELHGPLAKQRKISEMYRRMSVATAMPVIMEEHMGKHTKHRKPNQTPDVSVAELNLSKNDLAKVLHDEFERSIHTLDSATDMLEIDRKERDDEFDMVQKMMTYGRSMVSKSKIIVKASKEEMKNIRHEEVSENII